MSGSARSWLGWGLAGVLVATGLLQAAGALCWGAQVLAFPFESTRPEAFIHDGVRRVLEGRSLYSGFDAWPLVLHVYNPLTYLPTAGLARLFGSEPTQILLAGRLLSYAATLALAALLGWAGWRWTRDPRAVVLAPIALLLIHRVALTDFYRLRPESPALLVTLAGVWVVASRPRGKPYLAAVLFFAAFAIKQPFVSAPVATFVFLMAARRFADAGRFAATLGGLLAVFFAALYATTGTDYFASAIVSMHSNDVAVLTSLAEHGPTVFGFTWGVVLAGCVAAVSLLPRPEARFFAFYLPLLLAWTFYSSGKIGADINYYAELAVLLVLLCALAIDFRGKTARALASCAILALLAAQSSASRQRNGPLGEPLRASFIDYGPVVEAYRRTPEPRLVAHEIVAVHLGSPEALDWVLLELLETKGLVDLSELFASIRRGHYATIALPTHETSGIEPRILDAVRAGPYRLADIPAAVPRKISTFVRRRPAGQR